MEETEIRYPSDLVHGGFKGAYKAGWLAYLANRPLNPYGAKSVGFVGAYSKYWKMGWDAGEDDANQDG